MTPIPGPYEYLDPKRYKSRSAWRSAGRLIAAGQKAVARIAWNESTFRVFLYEQTLPIEPQASGDDSDTGFEPDIAHRTTTITTVGETTYEIAYFYERLNNAPDRILSTRDSKNGRYLVEYGYQLPLHDEDDED